MAPAETKYLVTDDSSAEKEIPAHFIRPEHDRPNLDAVDNLDSFPIIDLNGLNGPDHHQIVDAVGKACESGFGFFMVINHGIPKEVTDGMYRIGREFFALPDSERKHLYSEDPWALVRLGTSFNRSAENVQMWRDSLKLECHPLEEFVDMWPTNPPDFKKMVGNWTQQGIELGLRIGELVSESLGLEKGVLNEAMGGQVATLSINRYPKCPRPDLALGIDPHTDSNSITVLLQDDVSGLEVLRGDRWASVHPVKDAITINIGDQIQVFSNDRYKSGIHRVTVNNKSDRYTFPIFLRPSDKIPMKPTKKLVSEKNPAIYRDYIYKEYFDLVWDKGITLPCVLDYFKIEAK
ncbi:hypothetical protein LUZ60_016547 [Juncus effusus]|nr:hypothetical protein LUZ60_016547 [Juncus effusus]